MHSVTRPLALSLFSIVFMTGCNKDSGTSTTASTNGTAQQCEGYEEAVSSLSNPTVIPSLKKINAEPLWNSQWVMDTFLPKSSNPTRNEAEFRKNSYTIVTTNPEAISAANSCAFYASNTPGGPASPLIISGEDGNDGFPNFNQGWAQVALPKVKGSPRAPAGSAYLCGEEVYKKQERLWIYGPHFEPAFTGPFQSKDTFRKPDDFSPFVAIIDAWGRRIHPQTNKNGRDYYAMQLQIDKKWGGVTCHVL